MAIAVARAALQGAVQAIPAVGAQTGPVAAHAVVGAAVVTQLEVAVLSVPSLVTDTQPALTVTPGPALQVTQLCKGWCYHGSQLLQHSGLTNTAGLSPEPRITPTLRHLDVPDSVAGAVGETAPLLVIHLLAEVAPPALPADTVAGDTVAVAGTVGVHTVN